MRWQLCPQHLDRTAKFISKYIRYSFERLVDNWWTTRWIWEGWQSATLHLNLAFEKKLSSSNKQSPGLKISFACTVVARRHSHDSWVTRNRVRNLIASQAWKPPKFMAFCWFWKLANGAYKKDWEALTGHDSLWDRILWLGGGLRFRTEYRSLPPDRVALEVPQSKQ